MTPRTLIVVGGFVFGELGRVAEVGDEVEFDGGRFHVAMVEWRRVDRVAYIASADPDLAQHA